MSRLRPVVCTECGITWSTHDDFLNHLAAIERHNSDLKEMLNRQVIVHNELIGPDVPVLIEVSRVMEKLNG